MPNVGTGSVDLVIDKGQLGRSINEAVQGQESNLKGQGARLGSSFASSMGGRITAGLAALKIVDFFKDSIAEARESAKIQRQTEAVIRSTGGAAGVSAKQVGNLADSLSKVAGVDDEVIAGGENVLLTFTNVRNEVGKGNDIFNQATTAALDMSAALGQDMQSSVIQLGKALNDPIKGVTALQRVGVSFTASQREQIKTLVDTGNTLGAQKLILAELTKEFGGAAAAAADPAAKLGVAWSNFKERIGTSVLPVLNGFAGALGVVLDVAEKVPAPVFIAGGALLAMVGGLVAVGKVIEVWRGVKDTIGTVRDAIGTVRAAVSRLDWSQLAAGGVAAGIAAGGIFILTQRLASNRSEAEKWAKGFAGSVGGISETSLPKLRAELKRLQDQVSGKSLSIGSVDIFASNADRKASDRARALAKDIKEFEAAKQVAVRETGATWAQAAEDQGASAEQIGAEAQKLKDKHLEVAKSVKNAFADITPALGQMAEAWANAAPPERDEELKNIAKSVAEVRDVFGTLAPATAQGLSAMALNGELTAQQLSNVTKEAQQLRDGIASSFGQATSIVQAFGDKTTVSVGQIRTFFAEQVAAARDWSANVVALSHSAIDKGLLAEVASAGPKMAPLIKGLLDAVRTGNVEAINQAQADLRTAMGNAQGAVMGAVTPFYIAGQTVGQGAKQGIGQGVAGAAQALVSALAQAITAAQQSDARGRAVALGQSIGAGLVTGIRSFRDQVAAAGGDLGQAALNSITAIVKPGSPSKVTTTMGKQIGEGLAVGIAASIPQLEAQARAAAHVVLGQLAAAQDSWPGPASAAPRARPYEGLITAAARAPIVHGTPSPRADVVVPASDGARALAGGPGTIDTIEVPVILDGHEIARSSARYNDVAQRRYRRSRSTR